MSSNPPTESATAKTPDAHPAWPMILITVLVGIFAFFLVFPQFHSSEHPNEWTTLMDLKSKRLPQVSDPPNPLYREGTGLAVYGRQLDQAVPPEARIFLSGMLGKDNAPRLGYYFFLRNYLFPRSVEISVGQPAVYKSGDTTWMEGTDCDSPEVLKTNGFDLFLRFGSDNNIQIIPLTQRGVPKQ